MKKITVLTLLIAALFCLGTLQPALAQTATEEEQQLQQSADETDQEAANPEGEQQVRERLRNRFNVTEERLTQMREQKMGYGEIKNALSLAEQMPGGASDENVQKVLDLRSGETKRGWGQVAKELNVNLGSVVKKPKDAAVSSTATGQGPEAGSGADANAVQSTKGQSKGQANKASKGAAGSSSRNTRPASGKGKK